MSLLDVIGPVMVGPSSSHTAGACRLALLARHAFGAEPRRARFTLHGSFAKTARGHGTDLALIAGTLGAFPDDPMIPRALDEAAARGLDVDFATADLGDVHPNSVRAVLEGEGERVMLTGSSLGGGLVRVFDVDGFRIDFSGSHPTLLLRHLDTPGVIARVARVIADDDVNIATLVSARRKRGGDAMMSIEIDRPLTAPARDYLRHLRYVTWLRELPEVMRGPDGDAVESQGVSAETEVAS
ncbi:MAG: L-serine ammonia-lyase, iron-sulfur-dependent subunit beta [Trueperaceae bacterium]